MRSLCRDGWARGAEPQLQQKGEKPKRRASSKGRTKKQQPAVADDGSGSNGSGSNGSGSNGSNGSGGSSAAQRVGRSDSGAGGGTSTGGEAALAAAGGSSGDSGARSARCVQPQALAYPQLLMLVGSMRTCHAQHTYAVH